jgi:nitrogenase molybdenum-iron protein alpha/beta subunit
MTVSSSADHGGQPPRDRQVLSYLCGAYIAVGAVPDACLIVEGPYCVVDKADIHGSHDLTSTLLRPGGDARVLFTVLRADVEEVKSLILDRTGQVETLIADVCANHPARVILTTSFDFHQLLNLPLRQITARFRRETGRTLLHVPSKSLGGDWLEGYADVCEVLARDVPLAAGPRDPRDPRKVAVVGHLMDRLEPDQQGNLTELRRLLGALDLELVSTWLSGATWAELARVEQAGLVVSLPYARKAAQILAERLGVPLLELDLPVGLTRTRDFVARLGERVGRTAEAARFADAETSAALRDTVPSVERFLAGGTVLLSLDPHLLEGVASFCEEVGLRPVGAVVRGHLDRLPADQRARLEALRALAPDDEARDARRRVAHVQVGGFDGGVGDREQPSMAGVVKVPFGYPNYFEHPLVERPFLGFAGYRHLVDRLVAAVLVTHGLFAGVDHPAGGMR